MLAKKIKLNDLTEFDIARLLENKRAMTEYLNQVLADGDDAFHRSCHDGPQPLLAIAQLRARLREAALGFASGALRLTAHRSELTRLGRRGRNFFSLPTRPQFKRPGGGRDTQWATGRQVS